MLDFFKITRWAIEMNSSEKEIQKKMADMLLKQINENIRILNSYVDQEDVEVHYNYYLAKAIIPGIIK